MAWSDPQSTPGPHGSGSVQQTRQYSPYKREVVFAEGSDAIVVKKNRTELIKEIQPFLDKKR